MFNFHALPHQQALIDSKARRSFIIGPTDTGKTMGLLAVIASRLRMGHGNRYRAALVTTNHAHRDYLLGTANEAFEWVTHSVVNVPTPRFIFPDGGTIEFPVCASGDELRGWELNIVAFDHLTNFTKEQYEKIVSRVRDLPTAPARTVASVEKRFLFEPLPDWIEEELAQPDTSLYLPPGLSEAPKRSAELHAQLA